MTIRPSNRLQRQKKGGGRPVPVISSRAIAQNARTRALTCAVSRPSALKIRPASWGKRHAPKASPVLQVHVRVDACVDAIGDVDGREQDHVAQHVERVHDAGLAHRASCRLDQQLFVEKGPPVVTFRGDRQRQQGGTEGLVRVMVLAPRLHDLPVEQRGGRRDRDPGGGEESRAPVRDQRLRQELEVGSVGERDGLRLRRMVGVHAVDLGRGLCRDVRPRLRPERDLEGEAVPLQDAPRRGDHEDPGQVGQRLVGIKGALDRIRCTTIEVRQDRAVAAALQP